MGWLKHKRYDAFGEATDEIFYSLYSGWMVEATESLDTLDYFVFAAAEEYCNASPPVRGVIAGLNYVAFEDIQFSAIDNYRQLSVIDFGDHRVTLDTFLPDEIPAKFGE